MQELSLAGWLTWHVTQSSNRGSLKDASLEGWQHNQHKALMGVRGGGGSSGGQKFRVEQGSIRLDEHQKVEVGSKWEWDWYQMGM